MPKVTVAWNQTYWPTIEEKMVEAGFDLTKPFSQKQNHGEDTIDFIQPDEEVEEVPTEPVAEEATEEALAGQADKPAPKKKTKK